HRRPRAPLGQLNKKANPPFPYPKHIYSTTAILPLDLIFPIAGVMARTAMTMSGGGKLAEHLSVGVLAAAYPMEAIAAAVCAADKRSERVRDLPAEVVAYYVMALGLLMAVSTREVLRVLMEGLRWLGGEGPMKVASKAAISQARRRLGPEPLRCLWESSAQPMAEASTPGAFY